MDSNNPWLYSSGFKSIRVGLLMNDWLFKGIRCEVGDITHAS